MNIYQSMYSLYKSIEGFLDEKGKLENRSLTLTDLTIMHELLCTIKHESAIYINGLPEVEQVELYEKLYEIAKDTWLELSYAQLNDVCRHLWAFFADCDFNIEWTAEHFTDYYDGIY